MQRHLGDHRLATLQTSWRAKNRVRGALVDDRSTQTCRVDGDTLVAVSAWDNPQTSISMIKLGIANFESVREYQEIPLDGITLLYGANSSGKSIVRNALQVLAEIRNRATSSITASRWYNQGAIESGDDLILSLAFSCAGLGFVVPDEKDSVIGRSPWDVITSDTYEGLSEDLVVVPAAMPAWGRIESNISTANMCAKCSWGWRSGDVYLKAFELCATTDASINAPPTLLTVGWSGTGQITLDVNAGHSLILELKHASPDGVDVDLDIIRNTVTEYPAHGGLKDVTAGLLRQALRDATDSCAGGYNIAPLFAAAWLGVATWAVAELTRCRVIGPTRTVTEVQHRQLHGSATAARFPSGFAMSDYWLGLKGELVQRAVFGENGCSSADVIDTWLSNSNFLDTSYVLDGNLKFLVNLGSLRNRHQAEAHITIDLAGAADTTSWEDWAESDLTGKYSELLLHDSRNGSRVRFENAGSGMAFVLPILYYLANERWSVPLYIHEPELHLHPRMQAGLAEVFADAFAQSGKERLLILETHSELFALRLLRLIRASRDIPNIIKDKNLSAKDIHFIAVTRGADGHTRYKQIRVSNEGAFLDSWPNGFFQEQEHELFE